MNILFLSLIFPNIEEGDSNLYTDLAEEFKEKGHNVYVATILEKKFNKESYISYENGLNVLRVRTGNMFNVGFIEKGITTVTLEKKFINAIKEFMNDVKFELILYATPPVTFEKVIKFIKHRDGCKSYLMLKDIFPQGGKDLGILTNPVLFKYFRVKETRLYNISDIIGCMSQGNVEYIKTHNDIDENKLEVLPNTQKVKPLQKVERYMMRSKYNISEGKVVAVFGGNLGKPQELEYLLELAELYKEDERLLFLIIGKGTEKGKIEKLILEKNLSNVMLKDFIPRNDYEKLVSECDIGIINLNRRYTVPNIPSKTLSYFQVALPILASIDASTDYGKLLDTANAGLYSITGDLYSYKRNMDKLLQDKSLREYMGSNGRNYFEKNLGSEIAYKIIMSHFN